MAKHGLVGVVLETVFTEEMPLVTLHHVVERHFTEAAATLDQLTQLSILALVHLLGDLHVLVLSKTRRPLLWLTIKSPKREMTFTEI